MLLRISGATYRANGVCLEYRGCKIDLLKNGFIEKSHTLLTGLEIATETKSTITHSCEEYTLIILTTTQPLIKYRMISDSKK